jgi:hypothetical protein
MNSGVRSGRFWGVAFGRHESLFSFRGNSSLSKRL